MLDVRRLRVLREVAARGTIAAAARSLAYTPSAVSQQLSALEREASLPALRMGEVDVAISHENARHAPATEPRLQRTELFEEPLLLALPDRHDALGVDG